MLPERKDVLLDKRHPLYGQTGCLILVFLRMHAVAECIQRGKSRHGYLPPFPVD